MKINQIIRSKRKTIAIMLYDDGRVIIRAPLHASDAQIVALVIDKETWITQKQKSIKTRSPKPIQRKYIPGEQFLYLGKSYHLTIVDDKNNALKIEGDRFLLSKYAQSQAQETFISWYRLAARKVFTERINFFVQKIKLHQDMKVNYKQIRISSARTRWGSYSSRGTLSITWRLVMAPIEVIDYVVVHELVHSLENNHSRAFWAKVKIILPDYGKRRKWLKENGAMYIL